jgi:cytochrome c oxidase subunit IV
MSEQVIQPRTYCSVFVMLIALTLLTVGISFLPLGALHTVTGLTIATIKAVLVVLFFMHALHSSRLTWLVIASALFWLAILIGFTMSDYLTRSRLVY